MLRKLLTWLGKRAMQSMLPKPDFDQHRPISASLADNLDYTKTLLGSPDDLSIRQFQFAGNIEIAVLHFSGLIEKRTVNDDIIQPLLELYQLDPDSRTDAPSLTELENILQEAGTLKIVDRLPDMIDGILYGQTAVLVDGFNKAYLITSEGGERRSISEPTTEMLVRGPREAFVEDLETNIALLRRRVRSPHLRFDSLTVGVRSKTQIRVVYEASIANPELVQEVKRRIASIHTDSIQSSGIIEQWIMDSFLSPFPQMRNSERPDRVAIAIEQGKVAVLTEGTPFALVMPTTITDMVSSPEDHYQGWLFSSLLRGLRWCCAFIAAFLPALYVALVEFHQGLIPTNLALSIAGSREGVPFPALIEAMLMEITLEILREAGLRLPKPLGQTIGIVGGLVIGEAAVTAAIVSPIMVIVVALTAIASFSLPSYVFGITLRILRFSYMLVAGMFGLFGLVLCFIVTCIHLSRLSSFGMPYTAPFAPLSLSDMKTNVLRLPVTMLNKRPVLLHQKDVQRTGNGNQGG